jgi:hypothetical protein
LINSPEYKNIKEEMDGILQWWLDHTNDPFLKGEDHIKQLELEKLWNEREIYMHPDNPRLI